MFLRSVQKLQNNKFFPIDSNSKSKIELQLEIEKIRRTYKN